MQTLAIDIETYSSTDLIKSGVYKYVEPEDFTVLLFACSLDNGPIELFDLTNLGPEGKVIVDSRFKEIQMMLLDPAILKTAYNANFERTCLSEYLHVKLPPEQWECTMAKASMLGLPLSLDAAAKALKISEQKDSAGKALIRYFSLPCKPTKTNGGRTRNLPGHDMEKWEQFKEYCVQDVRTEQAIRNKIQFFNIPVVERKLWWLDQKVNDTGILLDPEFIRNAIRFDINNREKLNTEAIELTGLNNPNSATQLKAWLSEETDEQVTSLTKEAIPVLLEKTDCKNVTRVLQIRQEMSKTSVKKYQAMMTGICRDNRVRGLLQYYGANRTGRWAGRLIQVQNLPRIELKDLDLARQLVRSGDAEMLEILFGNVPDTLSQLIRTSFIASPGHRFIIADFSAIEARVIAWLAGEKWRIDVFNTHGKIYEASASQMFKVPIEQITKSSPLRQKGKISELALGYQGGPNALITMGALKMGVVDQALREAKIRFNNNETVYETWSELEAHVIESELAKLVKMWRNANKAIVKYWETVEEAAINAVNGEPSTIGHGIRFFMDKGILCIMLPSGRMLCYLRPTLKPNRFGGESIVYEGMNQTTKQWGRMDTYGGKLVENIVQAVARDCLADAMLRMDDAGYNICMHVHDEIVCDEPNEHGSTEEVNKIMCQPITWAKGLPLHAESYESSYYRKD